MTDTGTTPPAGDESGIPVPPRATNDTPTSSAGAPATTPIPAGNGTASNPDTERLDHFPPPTAPWVAESAASAAGEPPVEDASDEDAAPAHAATERHRDRNGLLVPIVVAAVIAALVGGGIGTGVTLAVAGHNSDSIAAQTSSGGNITINDAKTATAVTAVAAKASPSVVTINVSDSSEAATGSGIVLKSDGYVLTNNHVATIDGATSTGTITATTESGRIYKASIVGTDPANDLAVIKLQGASGLTPATFADSSKLNVGDTAIAIGAPLGLAGTVTNGIVSAVNRSIQIQSSAVTDNGDQSQDNSENPFMFNFGGGSGTTGTTSSISLAVLQTDAAINPGNSGGALLDGNGDVIGVNVAIASAASGSTTASQSGSIGVGFAIPANVAKRIGDELMNGEKATHGLLGATVEDATGSASSVAGALIKSVTSGGAASTAGLEAGDVVTKFNGIAIGNAVDLTAQVRALAGSSSTSLTYVRGTTSATVQVKLGTYTG